METWELQNYAKEKATPILTSEEKLQLQERVHPKIQGWESDVREKLLKMDDNAVWKECREAVTHYRYKEYALLQMNPSSMREDVGLWKLWLKMNDSASDVVRTYCHVFGFDLGRGGDPTCHMAGAAIQCPRTTGGTSTRGANRQAPTACASRCANGPGPRTTGGGPDPRAAGGTSSS